MAITLVVAVKARSAIHVTLSGSHRHLLRRKYLRQFILGAEQQLPISQTVLIRLLSEASAVTQFQIVII